MNYQQGNRGGAGSRSGFSRLIPHLKKPPRPFGQGGASARYHSCFSLCRSSCRYRKKKSPCPYGQGRHTRYHLALYLGLSLTRTNASLTDFNEVLSGDTLLFHTGSHLVRLSVISKSSLLLILACLYGNYYRAEGWTLSSGHRKDKRPIKPFLRRKETLIQSLSDFILGFLYRARNHLTRIASYLRRMMTKLCIKIHMKSNSAI